ncbi:hypothetical protein LCGC14_2681330, partial [marine sediment metagenome]
MNLRKVFSLEENEELYNNAITPKSCGGGDDFKYLALLGDFVLNLTLFNHFSKDEIKNSGELTKKIQSIHNEWTLCQLGDFLGIVDEMNPKDLNYKISDNEIKESIEALIGANNKIHTSSDNDVIVERLMDIIKENDFYDSNPVGKLIEFFHERGRDLTFPDPIRISKANEPPLFRCIIKESIEGEVFVIISKDLSRKCYARKDAAQKFLYKLGLTDKDGIGIKSRKKGVTSIPKLSLANEEIIFSKSSIGGGYFKQESMELSTETGEKIVEYAIRKAKEKPFFLLISLSGRLDTLSGSAWHASLPNGELILLHLKLDKHDYFDIGFAESK